ncbi:MAG TPA: sugar phosphate isomerase/epimerase family protein [Arsenophonus nasoniae]|uniref:sugar phosphate isomerase/epimerase family protein n=1 Tax=Arsenophonus nasoniae TaxID=638 RepID=UPI003879C853
MRLAISNIAWDVVEDKTVAALLNQYQVDAIDIAPGKYFSDFANTTKSEILAVKQWWQDQNIEITGMQSLLFGTTGLNMFATDAVRDTMLHYLEAVCRIGGLLGASRLVFGSPKNRDRTGLTDNETETIAIPFFQQLGDIAQKHNVIICLEPNPTCYHANYMTTSKETIQVVKMVNHPAIKMQLDIGALVINQEDINSVLAESSTFIGHIHISEPQLTPLGEKKVNHDLIANAIKYYLPDFIVSIEMIASEKKSHIAAIERAIKIANSHYVNKGEIFK